MTLDLLPVHFLTEQAAEELLSDQSLQPREIAPEPTKEALLAAIAEALVLPDYFGQNWDALDECLQDLELEGEMLVLVVHHAATLWQRIPREMCTLVDTWLAAAAQKNLQLVFVW